MIVLGLTLSIPVYSRAQIMLEDEALKSVIAEAMANNPELAGMEARLDAVKERVPQAGAWQDPAVVIGLANLPANSFDFNQEPMTAAWITAIQTVPLTREYALKKSIAQMEWERQTLIFKDRKLTVAENIAHLWYERAYYRAAASVVDEDIRIIDDILKAALKKYETGRAMQSDILRIETEKARKLDKKALFEQMAEAAGRKIAVLMGRQPGQMPDPPGDIPEYFPSVSADSLEALALSANPAMAAAEKESAETKEKVRLAKTEWWPDLKLSAGYGFRKEAENGMDRPDFITLTAGFTIPLFGKSRQSRAVQESASISRAADLNVRSAKLELELRLNLLLDQDLRLDKQIELYTQGVVPQAEKALSALTAAYSTGQTDIDALLNAQIALLNARLEKTARLRDRAMNRASLAALIGGGAGE